MRSVRYAFFFFLKRIGYIFNYLKIIVSGYAYCDLEIMLELFTETELSGRIVQRSKIGRKIEFLWKSSGGMGFLV